MRRYVRILAVAGLAFAWGCSSSGSDTEYENVLPPPSPPPPPPPGGDPPIVVNIIGERGVQSFSPNPATIPDGRTVIWRNMDVVIHRVLFNDRSVDTGDILPGASSQPRVIGAVSKPYHCSLHPTMLGGVNGAAPEPPSEDVDPYQ